MIGKADKYIKENKENKCLFFTSTDGNKKVLAKCAKHWDEIKHLIETINEAKKGKYEKDFLKVKFNSDDKLNVSKASKKCDICHY